MIKAVINVDAPPKHVFNVLSDFSRYKEWIPGCESCTVTGQQGNTTDVDLAISSMKRIELSLRFEAVPTKALAFRMTRGKDMKAYSGTYRLMDAADGKGTVVVAELEIDAGFMVPKFMVDRISRKMIDDTGAALRQHIAGMSIPTAIVHEAAQKP